MNAIDQIRAAWDMLQRCSTACLQGLEAEEVIRVCVAIMNSPWDIFPDQLTAEEIAYASDYGKLSPKAIERLTAHVLLRLT